MRYPRHAALHIVETTPILPRLRTRQFWLSFVAGAGFMALIFLAWVATP